MLRPQWLQEALLARSPTAAAGPSLITVAGLDTAGSESPGHESVSTV